MINERPVLNALVKAGIEQLIQRCGMEGLVAENYTQAKDVDSDLDPLANFLIIETVEGGTDTYPTAEACRSRVVELMDRVLEQVEAFRDGVAEAELPETP